MQIADTDRPSNDTMVFYQAIMPRTIVYTNDRWNIRIEDFPPYNDENHIFSVSSLPPLEIPVKLKNTGRKATTIFSFKLTMYSSPALSSAPGVIIDAEGNEADNQSVFVDVGQEQKVIVRFKWANLDMNAKKPQYKGITFDPLVFRGIMKLEVSDIEEHTSSVLIETGRSHTNVKDYDSIWWATYPSDGKPTIDGSTELVSDLSMASNQHLIQAFLKAGIEHYEHKCYRCALNYLTAVVSNDTDNADGYYYRGLTYKQSENRGEAEHDFRRCMEIGTRPECAEELEALSTE